MFALGLLYSFLCAFFKSLQDAISKTNLRSLDEYSVGFRTSFFSLILLFPFLLYFQMPPIGLGFFLAFVISSSINILVTILLLKAYKISDISLVSPLSTLTPVFLILTGPAIIGEYIGFFGYIGILFSILGSYILNMSEKDSKLIDPIKALFTNRGSQYMLLVAFLWSISSVYDKVGIQNSSPTFWLFVIKLMSMLAFGCFLFFSKNTTNIHGKVYPLFLLSFVGTIALFFQLLALTILPVAYVVSIKRFSSVLSVFWGHTFLQEKDFNYRIIGSLIMFLGILFFLL